MNSLIRSARPASSASANAGQPLARYLLSAASPDQSPSSFHPLPRTHSSARILASPQAKPCPPLCPRHGAQQVNTRRAGPCGKKKTGHKRSGLTESESQHPLLSSSGPGQHLDFDLHALSPCVRGELREEGACRLARAWVEGAEACLDGCYVAGQHLGRRTDRGRPEEGSTIGNGMSGGDERRIERGMEGEL